MIETENERREPGYHGRMVLKALEMMGDELPSLTVGDLVSKLEALGFHCPARSLRALADAGYLTRTRISRPDSRVSSGKVSTIHHRIDAEWLSQRAAEKAEAQADEARVAKRCEEAVRFLERLCEMTGFPASEIVRRLAPFSRRTMAFGLYVCGECQTPYRHEARMSDHRWDGKTEPCAKCAGLGAAA